MIECAMDILMFVAFGIKFKIYTVSIVSVYFHTKNRKIMIDLVHKTSCNHKKWIFKYT